MYGPLTPEQKRFVTRIGQTSQKMQSLVYTLVDLAWVESGMPMDNLPVDLDVVIRQAVADLDAEAREKHIPIAISIQQPMPEVMGDAMRLKQVVHNLLHNAIIYSGPEQPVAIHAFAQGEHVKCTVADRGIGIADNEIDQIFDRTYRSPNEAVRSTPGGGIGLTMARMILKRHGGTIEASSILGRGSTFMFTLPLAEQGSG
jgi:signal transduction histidine kinase